MIQIYYMPVALSKTLTKKKKKKFDLSNLIQRLRANKIALNVNNIAIFRSPRKQITKKMNFHLSDQKIRQKTCTKYGGVLIDKHVLFKHHIKFLKQKLNRANGIVSKLRHHLLSNIIKQYTNLFLIHMYVMYVSFGDKATLTY